MFIDLVKLKEELNISRADLSKVLDVALNTLKKWEEKSEIPAKFYYKLHLKYRKEVPLPADFWDYTPHIVRVNMNIYGITQQDIAKEMNIYQNNVHRILNDDILYDYKEVYDRLFPVIYIPCERDKNGKYMDFRKGENFKNLLTEKI